MKPVEEIAREIVNNRNPHAMLADVHLKGDIIAALRAERERAERAEYELNRWKEVRANAPDWEKLWAEQSARAEKAEAERDEALWDARFQIDAQVKSREAAETALSKAEAERDAARTAYSELMRLRKQTSDALATARNRALEEAAECAGEELTAYDEEGNDGEVWVVRKIVDAILALRTKEGE